MCCDIPSHGYSEDDLYHHFSVAQYVGAIETIQALSISNLEGTIIYRPTVFWSMRDTRDWRAMCNVCVRTKQWAVTGF